MVDPFKRYYQTVLLLLIFVLSACGGDDQSADSTKPTATPPTPPKEGKAPVVNNRPIVAGYQVVDTFNVGDDVYVRSLVMDEKNKRIWVGTSVGALEIDSSSRNLIATYTRQQGLANEYVFDLFIDHQGNKWMGTNGGGISRYNKGQWKTFFPMHGLADYWVYSFTETSKGELWVGTWAGISVFDSKSETFTNYVKELVNEWVYGLDVDSKDNIWIGTEGGVNMYDGKTWKTWTHKDGLGAPNAENLPISINTGLGTRSRHDLSVMEQGSPTYNPSYVFSLLVGKDDTVWVGTWGGGVSHFDGDKWTNFTQKDGLAGNIVFSVAQDAKGVLWFGTNNGLSRFDGKQWTTFTQEQGLIHNNIYDVATTADNHIWLGSRAGVTVLSYVGG